MTCDARACRNKIEAFHPYLNIPLDSLINEDYDTSFRNTKAYKEWISSTPRADDLNDVINLEDEYYSLFFPGAFSLDDGYDRTLLAKHEVPVTHWNWLMQKYPKQPSPVEIPFANC
uniref:Uncharacterized protein n=1 Tax=Setaria digitata TaxID=48799 RepID=A0A915PYE3_9BILA